MSEVIHSEAINYRPLERVFQNPYSRVLDFLILNRRFDYSYSDISNLAHVPPRTLQRIMPILLKEKLVVPTRKSGKAQMYELNRNSRRAAALEFYFNETIGETMKDINNEVVKEHETKECLS